jgi:hypothetical protein
MRILRYANFRRLFIGQAISAIGNNMVPVALAFAVLDQGHSVVDLGEILSVEAIAQVGFVLYGGVLADRYSRRNVMICADVSRGIGDTLLGGLLVAYRPSVLLIAILGGVQGAGGALYSPAMNGLTPSLVDREDLHWANALGQTASAGASVVGPAIAGLCVATIGPGWAIMVDGTTFLLNVILLLRINSPLPARQTRQSIIENLKDGWNAFWTRRWFRTLVLGSSIFNLGYGAFLVMGPVASLKEYGGPKMWAVVSVCGGVGAIVGGVLASWRKIASVSLRGFIPILAFYAIAPIFMSFKLNIALVAAAAFLGGVGLTLFGAMWMTAVQQNFPEELISRASSYDYFASLVTLPIGLALAGWIVEASGVKVALLIVGVLEIGFVAAVSLAPSVRTLSTKTRQ